MTKSALPGENMPHEDVMMKEQSKSTHFSLGPQAYLPSLYGERLSAPLNKAIRQSCSQYGEKKQFMPA